MLERLKELKNEVVYGGISSYMEKNRAYTKEYNLLKRKEEEYRGILERMTEEKTAIQIFRGMPSEVSYKCKYFADAVSENMYENDSLEIGKIFYVDKPQVVDGHDETIACISYSYLWLCDGVTEDYYAKVYQEWQNALDKKEEFYEENRRFLLLPLTA